MASKESIIGLSDLVISYKADPEKNGNRLAEKLHKLLDDSAVRNKIARAAGGYRQQLSIDPKYLIEEVRQEAILRLLDHLRKPEFQVQSNEECAGYIYGGLDQPASSLIDKHLGSRTDDKRGRTKGLSRAPFKWGDEDVDQDGANAVAAWEIEGADTDQYQILIDRESYLEKVRALDPTVHECLCLYLEGRTQKEIADIMDVNERTVRNYLEKAKQEMSFLANPK